MHTPIHIETYRDHTIKIIHDPDPESPRDYDNLGTMICWHRRYNFGDKHWTCRGFVPLQVLV